MMARRNALAESDAVIVTYGRSPIGRAGKGSLIETVWYPVTCDRAASRRDGHETEPSGFRTIRPSLELLEPSYYPARWLARESQAVGSPLSGWRRVSGKSLLRKWPSRPGFVFSSSRQMAVGT